MEEYLEKLEEDDLINLLEGKLCKMQSSWLSEASFLDDYAHQRHAQKL